MSIFISLMSLSIFFVLILLFDVKFTTSSTKRRLLDIQHMGDPDYIYYRMGNNKLQLIKYYIDQLSLIKKHKENLKKWIEFNHFKINVIEYITYKVLITLGITVMTALILFVLYDDNFIALIYTNSNLLISYSLLIVVIWKIDIIFLKIRYNVRRKQIKEEWQFFSSLFQMSVECGDNLYSALKSATQESTGFLKEEFVICLDEYESGVPLFVALTNLDKRLKVEEMSHFITFLKRSSKSSHEDFTMFVEKQRHEMQIYELNLIKEYEKSIPKRLTMYNALTFTADFIIFVVPTVYALLKSI